MYDVLVIGGGPGGSTISTFLARRGRKVAMLEKERHPRFHIGESLLPMNMPILERLGVMSEVREMGVVKLGADFSLGGEREYITYDFADSMRDSPKNAFEVTRSEFDEMLFRNAAKSGVDAREEVTVTDVDVVSNAKGGYGVTATAKKKDGTIETVRARYLVDATGRDTFLSKKFDLKRRNARHGSAAIFSHFRGVERRPGDQAGNISIYWFDEGWMWFIPLKGDVMSIGCVCNPTYLRAQRGTHEQILMATLAKAPAAFERMAKAERIADVRATGNYSYTSERMSGPGWVMVGDAFAFIDPVFSSGVYLAMNGAEHAAKMVDEILDHPEREAALHAAFDKRIRRGIGAFSWFIYRFTSPGMRWIFKNPRNIYRLRDAVTSMLAGDVFESFEIEKRFHALKLIYAIRSMAEIKGYVANLLQRRRNSKLGYDDGTLGVDEDQRGAPRAPLGKDPNRSKRAAL
ncbi:MAG: NAD(P)/FAD-dependent oxidoreductase [Polyangiaceae bacterium]